MPNWCYFEMAVGGRYDCVDKFVEYITNDYDKPHFARVCDVNVTSKRKTGIYKKVYINGECAWSVLVCFFDDPYSYYNHYKQALEHPDDPKYNHWVSSKDGPLLEILQVAKDLRLNIEIYSTETGMAFCEYYYIEEGEMLEEKCGDYHEYYVDDYDNYQEFCEDYSMKYPDDGNNDVDEDEFEDAKQNDGGPIIRSDYAFMDVINDTAMYYDKSKNVEMCHIVRPIADIDTILSRLIKK